MSKGDNSQSIFSELCPFFDLDFISSIKHPTAERWHPHAVLLFISSHSSQRGLLNNKPRQTEDYFNSNMTNSKRKENWFILRVNQPILKQ